MEVVEEHYISSKFDKCDLKWRQIISGISAYFVLRVMRENYKYD